jgi:UDP-glucuronate 4-epimerase
MRVVVTGSAGFIGSATARALLERGHEVTGIDNLNAYYDVRLKRDRLAWLVPYEKFKFVQADITDRVAMAEIFKAIKPERVVHLAAQPGVRYAAENPHAYAETNVVGFLNILEGCRHHGIEHLVFASTSSVYGANTAMPFSVQQNVDHPLSLYAATKKANELMAHSYAHLYGLAVTGLRFFTVYGPWGRPDMSMFLFTRNILAGRPIDVFNYGDHARDFTYIDDIVEGIVLALDRRASPNAAWSGEEPDPATSLAPYRLYNIGNSEPVELTYLIECIERATGKPAIKNLLPLQSGDLPRTYADIDDFVTEVGFRPQTPIEQGVERFVAWYRDYFG